VGKYHIEVLNPPQSAIELVAHEQCCISYPDILHTQRATLCAEVEPASIELVGKWGDADADLSVEEGARAAC
jgi:hypothetical protein